MAATDVDCAVPQLAFEPSHLRANLRQLLVQHWRRTPGSRVDEPTHFVGVALPDSLDPLLIAYTWCGGLARCLAPLLPAAIASARVVSAAAAKHRTGGGGEEQKTCLRDGGHIAPSMFPPAA